jgi:hypothetical protein
MKALLKPVCAALLLVATCAWADMSRDDAAAAAQRASGGRVLSVDRADSGGRPAWRVKVVTPGGEVRVIMLDAGSSSGGGNDRRGDDRDYRGGGGRGDRDYRGGGDRGDRGDRGSRYGGGGYGRQP